MLKKKCFKKDWILSGEVKAKLLNFWKCQVSFNPIHKPLNNTYKYQQGKKASQYTVKGQNTSTSLVSSLLFIHHLS